MEMILSLIIFVILLYITFRLLPFILNWIIIPILKIMKWMIFGLTALIFGFLFTFRS